MSGNVPYSVNVPIGQTPDGTPVFASRAFIDYLMVQIFNFIGGTTGSIPVGSIGGDGVAAHFLNGAGAFVTPSYPVGANPSAQVGTSATNGASTNFMRADAAPALNLGITPTWTGAHTFSLGLSSTTGAFSGALSGAGVSSTSSVVAATGFGCNGKTAQTAVSSGASIVTTASTNVVPFGYATAAQADRIVTLVNAMQAALVADGILS